MKKSKNHSFSAIRVLLIEGKVRQIMPLMESLHNLGCFIITHNTSKLDMGYSSKYPNKKVIGFCDPNDETKTYNSILKTVVEEKVDLIIPLNDFVAILLAKRKKEIEEFCKVAVNDWEVFVCASDKLLTMRVCEENNIPCPRTLIKDQASLDDIKNSELNFPLVIKPRTGYSAVGFRVITSEDDASEIIKKTSEKYGPYLIQEYIEQTDLQYKAEIFIDKEGNIKSACVFAKIRWYPISGGSSTLNVTVNRPDIINTCSKLLKKINWRGYADIDLIQDPRTNTAKVMEINPRITGSVKICYKAGVNFSKQIIEDYLGLPVSDFLDYKVGQYLRYLHTDILWFIKSPSRFKTKPSFFNFRHSVDQIWSFRDPIPWFTYTLQSIKKIKQDKKKRKL